jgi:hypothetical protein
MINQLVALVADESKLFPVLMGCALLAVTILLYRRRHSDLPVRRRSLAAMNLFFGLSQSSLATSTPG